MNIIEKLKNKIYSFCELVDNWDSYNSKKTTMQSINTAISYLSTLPQTFDLNSVEVFPMRNGGIQFDIGERKEIEIYNDDIYDIDYDEDYNMISKIKIIFN